MRTALFDGAIPIDEYVLLFAWGSALVLAFCLLIAVLLGVRLWNKAGADIRAANAQERIAEAAERCGLPRPSLLPRSSR